VKAFTLRLEDAFRGEDIAGVTSFIGEDASGSFGLLAGHERMIAVLEPGLSRYRRGEAAWEYLAATGGVVYFSDNVLSFASRRYLLGSDPEAIGRELEAQLQAEGELHLAIENLRQMEQDMLKRLWDINRRGAGRGRPPA
jgi:F-type H+-transporting ATPase subunit epsilon